MSLKEEPKEELPEQNEKDGKEPPLVPPKEKRPHQLPADFELTDARFNYAAGKGFDKRRIELTFEKFTNYWTGCGKPKKDWDATWRTWVLNEVDRTPRSNGRAPVSTAQDFADLANRLKGSRP